MPILSNSRHERFAQEVAQGCSASEAFVRSGYAKSDGNASRLRSNERVKARIEEIMLEAAERSGLSVQWVLSGLRENFDRAMQYAEIKLPNGTGSGEFKYDGPVANKALELIGKHFGMFADKVQHSGPGGGPIETKDVSSLDRAKALAAVLAASQSG